MIGAPIPTFVINLDGDADRLTHMAGLLDAARLPFERVPAVFGTALPPHLAPWLLNADGSIASGLKCGEVGCYGSHLVIHDRILREGLGPALLVLEDDLAFGHELATKLSRLIEELPVEWDIVRLSNPPKRAFLPVSSLGGGHELVRYSKIPNNTGAYLISPRGAAKFLAMARPRQRAVDEDMRRPWDCGLDTYGVVPPLIVSNIFDSRIDAMEDRGLAKGWKRPKLLTGRTEGLSGGLRRMHWNISQLGLGGWLACLWRNLRLALIRGGKIDRARPDYSRFRIGPADQ